MFGYIDNVEILPSAMYYSINIIKSQYIYNIFVIYAEIDYFYGKSLSIAIRG